MISKLIKWFCYAIHNNGINHESDMVIREFLKSEIDKIDLGYHSMYLYSGNLVLSAWIANRWYAFCSEIELFNGKELIFKKSDIKPSFEVFETIKSIYLQAKNT